MLFSEDILNIIIYHIYFNYYHKIDMVKSVSKSFYFIMFYIFNKYNFKENILLATNIKHYRPEIDQIEYINNEFIIFDNVNYIKKWINKSEKITDYYSYKPFLTKEIIYVHNNKLLLNDLSKYNYLDITDLNSIDKYIEKLKFTEYIIYYYYVDCIYCYVIDFIILPYFDERLIKKKTFLYYKKININVFYNHNINNINGIEY